MTSVFNSKITELENKVPGIKNLASKTELTAVENKVPNVSTLVKKTKYAAEISKIKNDYVTTAALNASHKDLIQKTYFDAELKKVDDKVSARSSEILSYGCKVQQRDNKISTLERDASYFIGKLYFDGSDGYQNYLVFQPVYRSFTRSGDNISS